ncbi:hypothetical protein SprV_0401716500 [Sparganum proliferum]
MQETSEVITQQLNRFGIHNAHKPAYSLRAELSRVKEHIPREQQTDVIPRIACGNFPIVNVCHMGRRLGNHIDEHKPAARRLDPFSLVVTQARQRDNRFNWDDTEVVAMANSKRARVFIEARHSNGGSINRQVGLDGIMKACNDHS